MKQSFKIISIIFLWYLIISMVQKEVYVNPTGTYKMVSKVTQKGVDFYGYSGHIQVKVFTETKIVMTFDVNKGAPTYNSGTFVDTLDYIDNKAIFKTPLKDPSCEISFTFSNKGVTVKETTKNLNCGCGFSQGVMADGYYSKTSAEEPVLKDPATGEDLK